eukprot:1693735-Amphidinium_carterae.1
MASCTTRKFSQPELHHDATKSITLRCSTLNLLHHLALCSSYPKLLLQSGVVICCIRLLCITEYVRSAFATIVSSKSSQKDQTFRLRS